MLTDQEFQNWCTSLQLSQDAIRLISTIRASEPVRRVEPRVGNVTTRYASEKMRRTIQAESHTDELCFVREYEYDDDVLEYYDQPSHITLNYMSKSSRKVTASHTPDYFVIRKTSAGWEECKPEAKLIELGESSPNRYVQNEDGTWSCPPGEQYAQRLGLFYSIRSSKEINANFQRNFDFLADYFKASCPPVPEHAHNIICDMIKNSPGIRLTELLDKVHAEVDIMPDHIYSLIASKQIFFDIYSAPLAEPDLVHIFIDRLHADSYALMVSTWKPVPTNHSVVVKVGATVQWDGKPFVILFHGNTETYLRMLDGGDVVRLPNPQFEELIKRGDIIGSGTSPNATTPYDEVSRLLHRSSRGALERAHYRYQQLILWENGRLEEVSTPQRTLRKWRANYKHAERNFACGFVGLLDQYEKCGNRVPRFDSQIQALISEAISAYETDKQINKTAAYGELQRLAEQKGLPAPSYGTLIKYLKYRPRYDQQLHRVGKRGAYRDKPFVHNISTPVPRHGDMPFHICHIDHTLLDIELVDSKTGINLGRPWTTILTDGHSRRVFAIYLSFDRPSYRSCMMTLHICVSRWGRLPQFLVVDGGKEFHSTYFTAALAMYECSLKHRPPAQPRFGSTIERLIGTVNTQFINNLAGNTQITKNVRQVSKSNNPKTLAVWTLGELYPHLEKYLYEFYDTTPHSALGESPKDAFDRKIDMVGFRAHRRIPYDDTFKFSMLPTTAKGTAKVQSNATLKINNIYYYAKSMEDPAIRGQQVDVKYDPFNVGIAYAFIRGQWVRCTSEYFKDFNGRSEREIYVASKELRKQNELRGRHFSLNARKLAAFMQSPQGQEATLHQRRCDQEELFLRKSISIEKLDTPQDARESNLPVDDYRLDTYTQTNGEITLVEDLNVSSSTDLDDVCEDL